MDLKPEKTQGLLLDHLDLLTDLDRTLPVLDLACGTGGNGLVLAQQGIPVVFADRSSTALEIVRQHLARNKLPGRTWQVDLELPDSNPLSGQSFNAIIVFRYLHRPLFPALLNAVTPGGLVVYETFTIENRRFGRPENPDFLLLPGELKSLFRNWEIIFDDESILHHPDRAVARIVAQKPFTPIFAK